jgi:uncharacterized protein
MSSDMKTPQGNPFLFGALALDDAFADRTGELQALIRDMENGQDVVVFAPRRYGKSSLIWAGQQALGAKGILVAQVDLMGTPTKERFAAALAAAIYEDIASRLERMRDKAAGAFRGLRLQPMMNVNPDTGGISFSFAPAREPADIDTTIEQLLELPATLGAERNRRTALVLDEFQEIVEIDPHLPKLLRAVFQKQPEVAHVYLGSKRHVMERLFNDEHEPLWRSAKPLELERIPVAEFRPFIFDRFEAAGRVMERDTVDGLLAVTDGHPHATQELAYFLWEHAPEDQGATPEHLEMALKALLRAEDARFTLLWEDTATVQRLLLQALSLEPGRPYSNNFRERHALPAPASLQTALRALERRELVLGVDGLYRIVEPFLAEWLNRPRGANLGTLA